MRFLCLAWTEQPSDPSINFLYRVGTTLQIFRHILLEPIWGIAHAVDELLYKKALAKIEVFNRAFCHAQRVHSSCAVP